MEPYTGINQKLDKSGKKSVILIADLGSFFHHSSLDIQRLVNYELYVVQLPGLDNGQELKSLCVYHKEDFENILSQQQKLKILQHHRQAFISRR